MSYGETPSDRRNSEGTVQMERNKDSASRSMPGPYPHAVRDTIEDCGIQFYGIPEDEGGLMMYEKFSGLKYKYCDLEFCAEGYVDTVRKNANDNTKFLSLFTGNG